MLLALALASCHSAAAPFASQIPASQPGSTGEPRLAAGALPALAERAADPVSAAVFANVSEHEPIYLLYGFRNGSNARIQVSFKYHLFDDDGAIGRHLPSLMHDLYVGYTQTVLWDLQSDSIPFVDTSYRPAFFWRRDVIDCLSTPASKIGLETGLEHESNGKAGVNSRSISTVYVQPLWDWAAFGPFHVIVEPRVWSYFEDADNPDIARFRGNFNLHLEVREVDGIGIASDVRIGSRGDRGYLRLGVTYPVRRLGPDIDGHFFVEYFNGYGETILDYDSKGPSQLRVGFMLVR